MAAPNKSDIIQHITLGDTSAALAAFKQLVEASHPQRLTEIILLESRFNATRNDFKIDGSITTEEFEAKINRLKIAILTLLEEITGSEKDNDSSDVPHLRDYHSYTCDRKSQQIEFKTFAHVENQKKCRFYYLYGGNKQSHWGFVQRIAYEIEGRAKDYLYPNVRPSCEVLKRRIDAETHPDFDIYRNNILEGLFRVFGFPVQSLNIAELLGKTITDLLQCPSLKGWRAPNVVCLYIRIGHEDWHKEYCIKAARWFIREFCDVEFSQDNPTFLFFFGVEYRENQLHIREEVETAVKESIHFNSFSELDKVTLDHIDTWLDKYYMIEEDVTEDRDALTQRVFGTGEQFHMKKVEKGLQRLIDEYNNSRLDK